MKVVIPGGEPFFYPGGDVGCLLIHGFPGAPEEMRWMGKYLAEQGFSVLGVRLFGLATNPADANRARWHDWLASVEDGYHMLNGVASKIVAMGVSTGGAMSLLLARAFPLEGIVVMSTPAELPDKLAMRLRPVAPLVTRFWQFSSDDSPSDWHDKEAEKKQVHYPKIPNRAAAIELHDALHEASSHLDEVTVPVLLMYAEGDGTTPPESAQAIHDRLASTDKQILWLNNSGHNIPRDADRQRAFEAAAAFTRRVTS